MSHEADKRLNVLNDVAASHGATPCQIVLAWMRQGSPSVIPLIAASTPQVLRENIKAAEIELDEDEISRLSL